MSLKWLAPLSRGWGWMRVEASSFSVFAEPEVSVQDARTPTHTTLQGHAVRAELRHIQEVAVMESRVLGSGYCPKQGDGIRSCHVEMTYTRIHNESESLR